MLNYDKVFTVKGLDELFDEAKRNLPPNWTINVNLSNKLTSVSVTSPKKEIIDIPESNLVCQQIKAALFHIIKNQ